ncbi:hypothetical protein EST38_g4797 [Candolleomyces aberdarensis]|uniref:Opi1-domain-containing protein n=1 Tax=Candolleomyces aberdarensis TaxID=2316362 RepID=A0A4Q2DPG8_9AGAR|nr:hypothetical protein EST38_g4797 [Candolleomyces aberdarensis]
MDRRMSLTTLDDEDESVRIAVKALDDMRNGSLRPELNRKSQSSSISPPSTSNAPSTPQASTSSQRSESQTEPSPSSPAFVSRMTSIPLLKSALTVYEQGKASSRVVKYGAEMVESSVRTLSRPVIDRLPVDVNQLDEFACRQLDRLDRYRRPSAGESSSQRPVVDSQSNVGNEPGRTSATRKTLDGSALDDSDSQSSLSRSVATQVSTSSDIRSRRGWKDSAERGIPSWIDSTSSFGGGGGPSSSSSRNDEQVALAPTPSGADDSNHSRSHYSRGIVAADVETNGDSQNEQQVAQRSRWQAVLLEAGGLSAALSEDSMRRLKYVLQWLQYATAHIDAQILILREFTASLQEYPPDAPAHARRPNPISEEHMRKLTEVRKDIVQTVRQVVDVVSKYAGGALPEPARNTVRGFILKLPQRWASKASATSTGLNGATQAGVIGTERDSVTAAASGAAGSARRSGHQRRNVHRGERGTAVASSSSTLDPNSPLRSGASSAVTSPAGSPRLSRATLAVTYPSAHARLGESGGDGQQQSGQGQNQQVSHGAAIVAAQRILSLATESLDMMRGVTGVVKDSLDRAELWIARLRTVGLQRAAQEGTEGGEENPPPEGTFELPPSLERRRHRRNSSSQFSDDMPPSPFFSGASTAWNSSIPSTPVGAFTPMNTAVYQGDGISSMTSSPPGFPNIASMTLSSRYNTPKSVRAELPDVDEMLQDAGAGKPAEQGVGEVRIVGVDDGRELVRESKMEVDPV